MAEKPTSWLYRVLGRDEQTRWLTSELDQPDPYPLAGELLAELRRQRRRKRTAWLVLLAIVIIAAVLVIRAVA